MQLFIVWEGYEMTLREMIDELNHLIGLGLPEDTEVCFGIDMARPGSSDETKVFVTGASGALARITEMWRESDEIMEDLPYAERPEGHVMPAMAPLPAAPDVSRSFKISISDENSFEIVGACRAVRQGDEYVCPACGIRWGIDEEKPCTAKCS